MLDTLRAFQGILTELKTMPGHALYVSGSHTHKIITRRAMDLVSLKIGIVSEVNVGHSVFPAVAATLLFSSYFYY